MNVMMEEMMNRRAQQDLHVNKTEHEITRQQVTMLVVSKDWYAQQPAALDSQSTVQRLSQVVQILKSLILSDEEAQALQAVDQKEHNTPEAMQVGGGEADATAATMQWRGIAAGIAAEAISPEEALQLGGGEADATAAAMQWRGSAAGPAAGVATTTMPLETTLCMTVKDKRSATVATSINTVTVPFVVPTFWVIPCLDYLDTSGSTRVVAIQSANP
ncbi:hypothetical protein CEUSTIGMA_g8342.t1 [Chlamydomonas eustigma]|uniref:Uncharacterized protein n=1 Tax=Chlamydomonas eustigma TaxID=1157962 RepID=A0A250XCT6_9CHLO|nr:hypothetical protein CEUSTIGMA_g8342.t1 [Chlamydomonas eustigma]|eukprot:GAX80907.1 hypothetical protein CEUSTIGMA_g8342.t1 [Chlamydomonas eustigma]